MRSKVFVTALLLAGSAVAVPAGEVFKANRAEILARSVLVVGETVFSVGKSKSSEKAGTSVGFSKAAAFACGNLDRLNYDRAQWPSDITADEKSIVWRLYRTEHPFLVKVEGGSRVCEEKTAPQNYLVVMAFPKAQVCLPPVPMFELQKILTQVRAEIDAAVSTLSPTNASVSVQMPPSETNAVESLAVSDQPANPVQVSPTILKMETLDEDMMF